MTRRRLVGVAAWAIWAIALTIYILAIYLLSRARGSLFGNLTLVGAFQVFPLVGAIIASLRPHNRIGWIFLAIGLGTATTSFSAGYLDYTASIHAEGTLATQFIGILGNIVWPLNIGLGSILLFLFPDGRLPSRRWRFVFWLDLAAISASSLSSAFLPGPVNDGKPAVMNPIGIAEAADLLNAIFGVGSSLFALLSLVSVVSLIVRYVRTQDEQRQRIKWFVFGAALMFVILILTFTFIDETSPIANVGFALGIVMLPIGAGVGVLKYRLYDVDILINRALVYALLTAILVVIYAVGVIGVQNLVSGFTRNADDKQPLLIVATTLVVATLFQPLRRRIQYFIDRSFYRTKYDAAHTLSEFGTTLRNEVELSALTEHLVGTIDDTMRPVHVSLWLRTPE